MAVLNGELAAGFAAIFGSFYVPARLRRHAYKDNGKGGGSACPDEWPCRVQVDLRTQRMGGTGNPETAGTEAVILILAHGLPDGVRDDDELEVIGPPQRMYKLQAPALDPLQSHYRCGARLKV